MTEQPVPVWLHLYPGLHPYTAGSQFSDETRQCADLSAVYTYYVEQGVIWQNNRCLCDYIYIQASILTQLGHGFQVGLDSVQISQYSILTMLSRVSYDRTTGACVTTSISRPPSLHSWVTVFRWDSTACRSLSCLYFSLVPQMNNSSWKYANITSTINWIWYEYRVLCLSSWF